MDKLKSFFNRYLKNYGVLLGVLSVFWFYFIETCARHSLIASAAFIIQNPLVSLCNILMILAVLSLALLFKKRVFYICIFSLVWFALGVINGIVLSNRMTPFNVKDMDNLGDGLSILTNYFTKGKLILIIAAIVAVVLLFIILYRKTPRLHHKQSYKKDIAVILIVWIVAVGGVNLGMKTGVLDTFFGNLAYAYRDNGVPYCFLEKIGRAHV